MSCCPAGSWPELKTDYSPKGKVKSLDGIDVYYVGEGNSKCILWNYDIFGFEGGRTRQLCDLFASHGFVVVMPDFYRGDWKDPFKSSMEELVEFINKTTNWEESLSPDLKNKVVPFAKEIGAKTFGTIGTCWGSYPVVKLSGKDKIRCGVSMHPSHSMIAQMLKEDEEQILKEIKCPQLFMPAGDDGPQCKKGGLAEKILKDVTIIEFPDMKHGWTTKGDFAQPNVERDVTKAISHAIEFFNKHL